MPPQGPPLGPPPAHLPPTDPTSPTGPTGPTDLTGPAGTGGIGGIGGDGRTAGWASGTAPAPATAGGDAWYPVPYGSLPPAEVGPATDVPRAASALRGDWRGALLCVGASAGAVYLAGLLLALFYLVFGGGASARAILGLPAAGVATSFGASWQVSLGGGDVTDVLGTGSNLSYHIRAYPLLLSALGVWVLARLATRRFAAGRSAAALLDRLTQAARVGLLLGGCCLLLALVSRQPVGDDGHVNADYALAFIGGLVIGALTVAVAALRHTPAQAPPVLRRLGSAVAEPLVAARLVVPVIVVLGLLQILASLVTGGIGDDLTAAGVDTTTSRSVGVALLVPFAPNSAWMLFGIVVGSPLQASTGRTGFGLSHTVSLLDLTAADPLWWLAPLVMVAVFFGAGTLLALRSPSAQVARQRVGVWSLVFAAVGGGLCYAGSAGLNLRSSFASIDATIGNEPVLVVVLSAAWALITGLGAVSLVSRLAPETRMRWARRVRASGMDGTPGTSPAGGAPA